MSLFPQIPPLPLSYRDIPEISFNKGHKHYAVAILEQDYESPNRVDHTTLYLRTADTITSASEQLSKALAPFSKKNIHAGCGELRVTERMIALRPLDAELAPALRALGILADLAGHLALFDTDVVLVREPTKKLYRAEGPDRTLVEFPTSIAEALLSPTEHRACTCLQIPARPADRRWFSFNHSVMLECDLLNYPGRYQAASINHVGTGPAINTGREKVNATGFRIEHPIGGKITCQIEPRGLDTFRDHDKAMSCYFFDGSAVQLLAHLINEANIEVTAPAKEALESGLEWQENILRQARALF